MMHTFMQPKTTAGKPNAPGGRPLLPEGQQQSSITDHLCRRHLVNWLQHCCISFRSLLLAPDQTTAVSNAWQYVSPLRSPRWQ
jgi:hypothetical protein